MQPEQKVNILLVDDHPENLLALEAILNGLGQNLVRATSGKEALRCLLNQDFAVILLDVQMPGMDGFETATLIRQRERSRYTPIIFLTAFSTSETMVYKGYSLGAVDYLFKPIEAEILTSKVTVFVDLFKKTEELKQQKEQLAAVNSELKQSEERFRCLSACSPVGIFMTDNEGRCTYTNPRLQALCGFSSFEQSLGEGWLLKVHPEDRDRVLTSYQHQKDQEYSNEFRLVRTNLDDTSELRWVHLRSSLMLSDKGVIIGYVGTLEDITERKAAEVARAEVIREQAARQEAETANRMKDEFLATLSHELRTPLNSILGWAQLLRTRNYDEKTTAKALETIERNAKLQVQLTEDILDVSRIIRGKLQLQICQVNLVSVIDLALNSARPAAEDKAIAFKFMICDARFGNLPQGDRNLAEDQLKPTSPNPKFFVAGDPYRLQQVIWNLISNALKFTPKGGTVEVRLLLQGSPTPDNGKSPPQSVWAVIQVIDTGIGISQDFLPYVFERFRQADSTTTRTYGGLGLGLAIVRYLVELHAGKVQVDSEGVGKGATFTVKLPLADSGGEGELFQSDGAGKRESKLIDNRVIPPLQKHTTTSVRTSSDDSAHDWLLNTLNGLQVLVVDDDIDTREFLTSVLEQSGANVTAVASVKEAMLALALQPDVIVSDIGMPQDDGYELIRQVREMETGRNGLIPAIALTAYARDEERSRAIAAGFQMHAPKPIEPAQLIALVAQLAGRTAHQ